MNTTFNQLKSSRKENFDKLTEKLNQMASGGFEEDPRLWQPTVDKAGNGYAVIRFLPAPQNEEQSFVRIWGHGFKGPGGWYIENSLTTINKEDPVAEFNTKLWEQGEGSEGRKIVSGTPGNAGTKRNLSYYSNIFVVEDPEKPENNGKVFLFRYGKKIFDKLNEAMNPKFKDVVKFNPFDLWEGANFKLKIRRVEGYRNYDSSEWDLIEDEQNIKKPRGYITKGMNDKKLEEIWKSEYSLQEMVAPNQFKSYNELKQRLYKVMKINEPLETIQQNVKSNETPPWVDSKQGDAEIINETPPSTLKVDDDDEIEFFKKLKDS